MCHFRFHYIVTYIRSIALLNLPFHSVHLYQSHSTVCYEHVTIYLSTICAHKYVPIWLRRGLAHTYVCRNILSGIHERQTHPHLVKFIILLFRQCVLGVRRFSYNVDGMLWLKCGRTAGWTSYINESDIPTSNYMQCMSCEITYGRLRNRSD